MLASLSPGWAMPPTSPLTTLGLLGEPGTGTGLGCSPGQDLSDDSGSCLSWSRSGSLPEQLQFWQPRPEAN